MGTDASTMFFYICFIEDCEIGPNEFFKPFLFEAQWCFICLNNVTRILQQYFMIKIFHADIAIGPLNCVSTIYSAEKTMDSLKTH